MKTYSSTLDNPLLFYSQSAYKPVIMKCLERSGINPSFPDLNLEYMKSQIGKLQKQKGILSTKTTCPLKAKPSLTCSQPDLLITPVRSLLFQTDCSIVYQFLITSNIFLKLSLDLSLYFKPLVAVLQTILSEKNFIRYLFHGTTFHMHLQSTTTSPLLFSFMN